MKRGQGGITRTFLSSPRAIQGKLQLFLARFSFFSGGIYGWRRRVGGEINSHLLIVSFFKPRTPKERARAVARGGGVE